MIREHDCVVLTADVPAASMLAGDVGTVIHVHGSGEAYEVEFVTLTGSTVAIATVSKDQLRPVSQDDINHVRVLSV